MKNGIIKDSDTLGIKLRWGDYNSYREAIRKIVYQPNEFYAALAKGVEYAASKYGGLDFALSFGGNEMPGYHTGIAAYLTFLTGSRHSHLDSAGYIIDEKSAATGKKETLQEIVENLFKEESWRQVLSSLVLCFFARGIYTPKIVVKSLNAAGFEHVTEEDLRKIGVEILRNKYLFKTREGFDPNGLRIPRRILEKETPLGVLSEDLIRRGVEEFFKLIKTIKD